MLPSIPRKIIVHFFTSITGVEMPTTDGSTCDFATVGSVCNQQYNVSIQLTPEACTLDGEYLFTFTAICRDIPAPDCPFDGTEPVNVTAILSSENRCHVVTLNVPLTATVVTTDTSGTSANTFTLDSTINFNLTLISSGTITQTTIPDITMSTLNPALGTLVLRSNDVNVLSGVLSNPVTLTNPPDDVLHPSFSVTLDPSVLFIDHSPNGPDWSHLLTANNAEEQFIFDATVSVVYAETSKRSAPTNTASATISTSATVTNSPDNEVPSAGNHVSLSLFSFVFVGIFSILFLWERL